MFKIDTENNQLLASEKFMNNIMFKDLKTGVYEIGINDVWHYFDSDSKDVYNYYIVKHIYDDQVDVTQNDPLYQSYVDDLIDHLNNEISYFKSMYGDDIFNN